MNPPTPHSSELVLQGILEIRFTPSIHLHPKRLMLQTATLSVSEIAYQVGYSALNNFSDTFMEEFGERPTGVRG